MDKTNDVSELGLFGFHDADDWSYHLQVKRMCCDDWSSCKLCCSRRKNKALNANDRRDHEWVKDEFVCRFYETWSNEMFKLCCKKWRVKAKNSATLGCCCCGWLRFPMLSVAALWYDAISLQRNFASRAATIHHCFLLISTGWKMIMK